MGAFNGSGTFVRSYNWQQDAVNGINISASRFDTEDDGFASGLSNCITRDGQGIPTANIAWGGFNLTGVGSLGAASAAFSGAVTGTTASFSTSVTAATAGQGSILIAPAASASGKVEFYNIAGTRIGYIYQPTTGAAANKLLFAKDDGTGFYFLGGALNSIDGLQVNGSGVWHAGNLTPANYALLSGAAFTGGITGTTGTFTGLVNAGGLQVSGNAVWHAGNLTPSNYALLSGASTFSGAIRRDGNFYLDLSGATPVVNFDSNDWISFDRTANKYYFNIGGTAVASIDASGNLKVLGNITASAGTV